MRKGVGGGSRCLNDMPSSGGGGCEAGSARFWLSWGGNFEGKWNMKKKSSLKYEFMGSHRERETFTCAERVWGKKKILARKVEV